MRILTCFLLALPMLCSGGADAAEISSRFTNSYALVIGIDNYSSGQWGKLRYAVKDAEAVGVFLREQGFKVTVLLDDKATRASIIGYFDEISGEITESDRFFFYFGGHGTTEETGGRQFGYLVPFGSGTGTADLISTEDLKAQSQRIGRARHQLFIINACFGGLLGVLRSGVADATRDDYLEMITRLPARQFIAAGGPAQSILDGGPSGYSWFTYYLLEALDEGKADLVDDDVITFAELTAYLVPRASNDYQTPSWGFLYGHGLGEFVFAQVAPSTAAAAATMDSLASPETSGQTVTRGGQAEDINEIRKPVDNLYLAWEKLDLDLYLKQWSPIAVQYLPMSQRTFDVIREKRTKDFERFSKVEVVGYQVHCVGTSEGVVTLAASYDMNFYPGDGRVIREYGVLEIYKVRYSDEAGQWQIVENRDYMTVE